MQNKAVEDELQTLELVPDNLKTKTMCERAIEEGTYNLKFVADHFKTQEICDKTVRGSLYSLQFVPDWLNTKEQLKVMGGHCNYIWFIKRYEGYKKRKTQKAKIKQELNPISWRPSSW